MLVARRGNVGLVEQGERGGESRVPGEQAVAAPIVERARAQAQQIVSEAEQAAALISQAHGELARLREQAASVVERVRTAAVEHAREVTASEALRLRQEAVEEAEEVRAAIIDLARKEAQRIRSEAEREAVLFQAEPAADPRAARRGDPEVTLLRASEIGSRDFPVVPHGFDPESVRSWLEVVEASYATLEEELHHARREWERVLEILEGARS